MKKVFYLLAVLAGTITLSSCSDDDNDGGSSAAGQSKTITIDSSDYASWAYFNFSDGKVVTHTIEPVAGLYSGDINITVGGKDYGSASLELAVAHKDTSSYQFTLKDFKFLQYDMEDVSALATVTADTLGWMVTIPDTTVNDMKLSGTGIISGKSVTLKMAIQPGGMPRQIIAEYTGTMETSANVNETSFDWDIALHAYDVKTNGGSGLETTETELNKVIAIPSTGFVADVETDSLIVDRAGMMIDKVGYASGHINPQLNRWMKLNLSVMPPTSSIYSMGDKVYIVRTQSGKYAKLKFTGFRDDNNNTGHITFDYVYPFE